MGDLEKFEELSANKQQLLDRKKTFNLDNEEDYDYRHSSSEFLKDEIMARTDATSYADRTKYYFEDQDLLEAKVEKYRKMGADEKDDVKAFATKHDNHSARKRKRYSKDAADSFEKALKQERKFSEDGKSPMDIYKNREKIMSYRLDGMIKAAKAKSTSKENEAYRIAKCTISCYSELRSQLQKLVGTDGGAEYEKILNKLEKEINTAQANLIKNTMTSDEKWEDTNGFNDPEVVEEKLADAHKHNPDFKVDGLIIIDQLNQMIAEPNREEYRAALDKCVSEKVYQKMTGGAADRLFMNVCHYIKRDAHGNPINKDEQKKEEWNRKWLEAVSDATKVEQRHEMMVQAFQEFEQAKLPTMEEIQKKGLVGLFQEDPFGFYELIHKSTVLDNMRDSDPYAKAYIEAHPLLNAKADALASLSNAFKSALIVSHGISFKGTGDDVIYAVIEKSMLKDYAQVAQGMLDNTLTSTYPRKLEQVAELESVAKELKAKNTSRSLEDLRKENDTITEDSYELYKTISKENVFMDHPAIKLALKKAEKSGNIAGGDWTISRALGLMMHNVHYDENWVPLTEEDERLHKENLAILENLEKGDQTKNDLVIQNTIAFIQDFTNSFRLPTPEEVRQGWFVDLMKNEPAKAATMMRVGLQSDNLMKVSPAFKDYVASNLELSAKLDAIGTLSGIVTQKCGIDLGLDVQLFSNCKVMGKEEQSYTPEGMTDIMINDQYAEKLSKVTQNKGTEK